MTAQISLDEALAGTDQIRQVRATESGVHWLASIAAEDRRTTIRRHRDGKVVDLTPAANVRSRVMEYGGGAYDAADALVAYVDDISKQLFVIEGGETRPITPPQERYRYGGLHLAPHRRILVAVREDHDASPEPRTEIVSLDLDGDNSEGGAVVVTGADFYAGPQVRGDELAWFQWMHPNMSWDSSEVMRCSLDGSDDLRVVAGGHGVSAQHPLWLGNALVWCSDESGYWNWYHGDGKQRVRLALERDCDVPTWVLDAPPACVVNEDLVATVEIGDGAGALTLWQPSTGGITRLLPGTSFVDSISSLGEDIYVIAFWPNRPESLVHISPDGTVAEIVGGEALPGPVTPEVRWAQGEAGAVQSWFYAPRGVQSPPLLVRTHGGPTSSSMSAYDREFQFWISRGFAVLDVNYSGSTGFGRAYRDRLKGRWGLLDVSDVVAAVRDVTGSGLADPGRVAIMGGSAGGYTTLQALVTTDVFAAGISSYGIADLRTLATDTHKAESRYTDSLVGPWPEAEQTYLERSPITQLDQLATPMLILQGMDDKVVPPNQAFDMAEAVRAKGQPLALITFDGEGHGFRSMSARRQALEAKVSFLQQVFGMEPSADVPLLEIENLS